jgi:CBS domain-containing protein
MKTVRDLLRDKGRNVFSVTPTDSVYDAIKMMAEKGIGALVVLEAGKVAGIVSERDYARKVILQGKHSRSTAVGEIMTTKVVCVAPDRSVEECMALMTDKRIRHLPVLEQNRLVGVVSIGDVVRADISDKQFLIEQLVQYITRG